MKPPDLGLPWPEWRTGQWEVIARALSSDKRYILIEAPPGIGKTGIALAITRILEARAHYLTGTIQLQQQYAEMQGVTQVLGRPNFYCHIQPGDKADEAPCTAGMQCEFAGPKGLAGCDYFDQKKVAAHAHEVVFNYPYWLRQMNYAGWRQPEVLVADEAHTLANQVRSFAEIRLGRRAMEVLNMNTHFRERTFEEWREWAQGALVFDAELRDAFRDAEENAPHETDHLRQRYIRLVLAFRTALRELARADDDWIVQQQPWGWEFKPVWVHQLVPKYVLRHAEQKVVLLSATILSKEVFCGLNGIRPEEAEFIRSDSTFSKSRRPVYFRPVGRVSKGQDIEQLIDGVLAILALHPTERGLVHTVSHRLSQGLSERLRGNPRIITHTNGPDRLRALAEFKRTPGAVLISPSMHTGVDLPYDLCRFQVICKLPFPDMGDPLVKAQMANATRDNPLDKGQRAYTYDTAATLVQTYGRIMRAEDDSGTTYLLDGNYKWFKHSAREFLPKWFTEAVKVENAEDVDPDEMLRELRAGALASLGK